MSIVPIAIPLVCPKNKQFVYEQAKHIAFVSLKQEIESQKQKIIDVEHNNILKADCKRELNESLKMVMEMVKKETMLDKECQKGI